MAFNASGMSSEFSMSRQTCVLSGGPGTPAGGSPGGPGAITGATELIPIITATNTIADIVSTLLSLIEKIIRENLT